MEKGLGRRESKQVAAQETCGSLVPGEVVNPVCGVVVFYRPQPHNEQSVQQHCHTVARTQRDMQDGGVQTFLTHYTCIASSRHHLLLLSACTVPNSQEHRRRYAMGACMMQSPAVDAS